MRTKREVLKVIAKKGSCEGIKCFDCPYYTKQCPDLVEAMTLLQMFPKNLLLDVGTKIKFPDKKITVVDTYNGREYFLMIEGSEISLDYLIGRNWEVVE